ncbi:CHAT domain-containing protein [Pseudonocardia sp. C8]|uniref:CHAT domain-containing protein n=1 Tax=Pseudonocardia sp. C8 TaxID=2762759 RepID=UPI00210671E6|nr:CHAT domain-containing protein [Pseudonocardia sp. C8]
MHRVVVGVEEIGPAGWTVTVRLVGPHRGAPGTNLVAPYRMAAADVAGRRVPALPPERAGTVAGSHAPLCEGDPEALAALLSRIRRRRNDPDDVRDYGRWLFECLLGEAWEVILGHPDISVDHAVELALSWPATAADLHRMVWESMRDTRAPLAGHPDMVVAITRLVPAEPRTVGTIDGVPSVLFATSVALTDPTIRPGAMYMGLLQELDSAGHCRARAVNAISVADLQEACARWKPDLVHLVAHGVLIDGGRGALMLRGDDGMEREADAAALIRAMTSTEHRPVAVALSACNTAGPGGAGAGEPADPTDTAPLAAQLVAGGIPVVSAMAGEIRESACRLYTRRLAAALHRGLPVVQASAHGRRAALIGSAEPSTEIDWALPALFLAEHIDPGQRLIDAERSGRLTALANSLRLRQEPVFIGRADILARADATLGTGEPTGVVAVLANGSSAGLGGPRLLREIGWRALRDGHVPLLLGPFQEATKTPTHGRALVQTLLDTAVTMTEQLGIDPFAPLALLAELTPEERSDLQADLAQPEPGLARASIRRRLLQLRDAPGELIAAAVRDLLATDLARLAERAAGWGAPFGEHTRVLVLCDDVHAWAAPPRSGLRFLLDMLDPAYGLGRRERPAPVVFTASTTECDGTTVDEWCRNATTGLRRYPLDDLTPEERVVGYQWVLLHPWTARRDIDPVFGGVYTPRPESVAEWEQRLRGLAGRPTIVWDRLYAAADEGAYWKKLRCDDDEGAWSTYVDNNPGYRL